MPILCPHARAHTQVLAGELQLDMCILNLTSSTLTDDSLAAMLREAPSRAIIVLEDVDAIFVSREEQERQSWDGNGGSGNEGKAKTTVSFSGLLNAIDGVAAQEGRIFYMTTVHCGSLAVLFCFFLASSFVAALICARPLCSCVGLSSSGTESH